MPTPICVISTTGTSVLTNREPAVQQALATFRSDYADADDTVKRALATRPIDRPEFVGADLYNKARAVLESYVGNTADLRRSCAEVNSLLSILSASPATPNDVLHFLATDTAEGVLAGRIVADFCGTLFGRETKLHIIEGLQVKNAGRFRRLGLPQLVTVVYSQLRNAPGGTYERVLNPTGGFKAVVPYLTMIGMLEGADVSYLYDGSEELVTLAPLPLAFDSAKLTADVVAQLHGLHNETVDETTLRTRLAMPAHMPLDAHLAWPLIETVDVDGQTHVTLNGLGLIVVEALYKPARTPVWLSRQAWERYQSARPGSEERRTYQTILNGLHDPQRRQNNVHTHTGTRFPAYKVGRTNERAFYHDAGDHILVLEFAQHVGGPSENYDRLPTPNLSDYSQHKRWEGQDDA